MNQPAWRRALTGGVLLGASWAALQRPSTQRLDVALGDLLRWEGSERVDRFVARATDLGSLYAVAGMAAVLALAGHRRRALDTLGAGSTAWVLTQTNKRLVRRRRPYHDGGVRRLVRPPTGSSFPSGHAAVGMTILSQAAAAARSRPAAALLHGLGAAVGASRVYVGVHYPTDVLGGAGVGLLLSALWRSATPRPALAGPKRVGR